MFVPQLKNAALAAMLLCIGSLAAADAWGKPRGLSLPDRNPKRESTAQPKTVKVAPEPAPAPTGPIARLPELLEYKLSDADKEALKSTVRSVYKRRFPGARASMVKIKDKTARKLAQWYYYRRRGNDSDPAKIEAFRKANPDWPSQKRLQRNAEASLLTGRYTPQSIKLFFASSRPLTGA
jgi:hypothetical protein